jgi:hypothetical protein
VPGWLDRAGHLVALALAVLLSVTLGFLQLVLLVFLFEGHYERELAREGIVQGGDALNMAVGPALWVTLAVVAVEVLAVVLLLRRADRRRRRRSTAASPSG